LSEELEINLENEGIIEFICEGGYGSEARIIVELRTRFPGIGGTILTLINFRAFLLQTRAEVSKDLLAEIIQVLQELMP